jgi:hypothetical protein
MAGISGKEGTISWAAGNVAGFDNWNMDINVDMLDVTSFSTGTLQWREFTPGLSAAAGTISGNFDAASTGLNDLIVATVTPATGTLILEADKTQGGKYTVPAYLSTLSNTVAIDGKSEVSFGFQGTGTVTYTTTT